MKYPFLTLRPACTPVAAPVTTATLRASGGMLPSHLIPLDE